MRPGAILVISVIVLSFFSCGSMIMNVRQQQTVSDGSHNHPYLESQIAQVRIEANSTNSRQATQIAALQATQQVIPSLTPIISSPTSTNTAQVPPTPTVEDFRTPSNTPFPTFTPTPATPQNTPLATSTARPSATSSPSPECQANGDFVPNTTINRRNAPSLSGTIIQPQLIAGRIEVVCIETLTTMDTNLYKWIQLAEASPPEFFAVGREINGTFEWYGTLTSWGE